MVCKLYHKQNPRLDKRFHPVDIPSEKGRPSRMCPGPIIIQYLHKYSWTEISNSNFNFYTDTFIYCTAPKQQLWCLVWTPPSPPGCEAGLWLTESLSSSVAVVDWLKRLNPSLSFTSDSYKPQSVQMMEFPVTKWDLPHGYQADFAPQSCSCSSGKSIKKSLVTWVCSELQVQPMQLNSQNAQIKRHSGWFCWEETVLMAFQVKGKCENVYHVTLCSRPAGAVTGFCSQTVWYWFFLEHGLLNRDVPWLLLNEIRLVIRVLFGNAASSIVACSHAGTVQGFISRPSRWHVCARMAEYASTGSRPHKVHSQSWKETSEVLYQKSFWFVKQQTGRYKNSVWRIIWEGWPGLGWRSFP